MAFPEVIPVLSSNLSMERVFNGVSEQRLFINQPVEVRVWPEGLEYHQGKFSGGVWSFLSLLSPKRSRFPQPFNRPLPAAETVSVCLALDIILIMLLSCDNFTVASAEELCFVGSMLYGSRPVLPEGAAKTSSMSCAATCRGL